MLLGTATSVLTMRVEHLSDSVQLILGDCRDVLPTLGKVDVVFVDPPYGETNLQWDKRVVSWPSLLRSCLKATGSMWVFGSQRMFLETASEFAGWRFAQDMIWEKHNGSGLHNDRFRRVHELVLQFYLEDAAWADVFKSPQFTYDAVARTVRKKLRPAHWHGATNGTTYQSEDGGPRLMRSVIYERSEHSRAEHPTQKPTGLIEPLLLYACPPGGIVLDPMMGAGSVGICAREQDRGFIGVEANEEYFDIACRRITDTLSRPMLPMEHPKPAKQEALL